VLSESNYPWLLAALLAGCGAGKFDVRDSGPTWEMDPSDVPMPYGFWGLNGYIDEGGLQDVQDRLGATIFHTSTRHPNYGTTDLLPLVRAAGLRVNLRMVGGHEHYTDAQGDFDLAAWKAMLDPWAGSGVQPFIDDGTLSGHMLLDDITEFEGRSPTADALEEMARYSKELLPGLTVIVREKASAMPPPAGGRYEQVDAIVNQYRARDGDVEDYALLEAEQSVELGLTIINGLNIADGGDGSSGQPGWSGGRWAMSAEEIVRYGTVLSATPGCGMFLNWEYDGEELWSDGSIGSDYFDQPLLQEALASLGRRVAGLE